MPPITSRCGCSPYGPGPREGRDTLLPVFFQRCLVTGSWLTAQQRGSAGSWLILLQAPNQARDSLVSAALDNMCIVQTGMGGTYLAIGKKLSLTAFTAPGHRILSPCMKIFWVKTFLVKRLSECL